MIVAKKVLFGIPVSAVTLKTLPNIISELFKKKGKKTIFYINAHCINLSQIDPTYKKILQEATMVYSGGIGPIWASYFLGNPLLARTPTPDFIQNIFAISQKNNWTIYLLGSDEKTVKKAAKNITEDFPSLIVGFHHGYFSQKEEKNILDDINKKNPTILFVGMGTPKQEKWIESHKNHLNTSAFWAVGALFDVLAGRLDRAPKWMQALGLEWLFRLSQEPRRLWKRYIFGNSTFLLNTVKALLSQ